ncbi:MAG: transketolase, partial [Planctomycetes bacterium]|nr:transketolase [Planctomycetota bacterium]
MHANVKELQETAKELRKNLLAMIHKAKSGHPGGSLSASDIITALYFHEMNIKPEDPKWRERDRFVLSKGHCCPVVYTALAMRGYFPMEELNHLRQIGHMLQGHPYMCKTPGIDMTTGSLGQGLSAGVGMALAAKRDNLPSRVFVLMGDGETQEGQIWEAAETAAKYQLDNLVGIVDKNRIQNDDFVEVVMPIDDLAAKWRAFNWEVVTMKGHC